MIDLRTSSIFNYRLRNISLPGTGQKVSGGGVGGPEQRGGGSSVFEPLERGGSFDFQRHVGGGSF